MDDPNWKNTTLPGDLPSQYESVGNHMKGLGYKTHFVGKWGVDSGGEGHGPKARGFDTFFGLINSGHNHWTKESGGVVDLHRWNETVELDWPEIDAEPEVYSSTMFTREAVQVISQHATREDPFFLHLSYTAPHDPLQAPEEYIESPACTKHRHNERRQKYCGMVQSVDIGVGDITKALIEHDMLQNTIIMFTSDNGGWPMVGGYIYPYRGAKASQWEGGVHVPGFLFAPGLVEDQDFEGLFHISDWSPTIQALVGGVHPQLQEIDGMDQSAALKEKRQGERESLVVDWNTALLNQTAIIERIDGVTWKLVAGSTVEIGLFNKEPIDRWSYNAEGSSYLQENCQVMRDLLSWLNEDLFFMEMNIHLDMIVRYDERFATSHSPFLIMPPVESPTQQFPPVQVTLEEGRFWLFNLDNDRTETTNLASQNPQIVNQIVNKYNMMFKDVPSSEAGMYMTIQQAVNFVQPLVDVGMLLMPVLKPLHAMISKMKTSGGVHSEKNRTFLP